MSSFDLREVKEMLSIDEISRVIKVTPDLQVLTQEEVLKIIQESDALILGSHFELTGKGRHTPVYFQSALLASRPVLVGRLAEEMARHFRVKQGWRRLINRVLVAGDWSLDFGQCVAGELRVPLVWTEGHEDPEKDELDADLELKKGWKVLVVALHSTTGTRVNRLIEIARIHKAKVAGIGIFLTRGQARDLVAGWQEEYEQVFVMAELQAEDYSREECPLCLRDQPVEQTEPYYRFTVPIKELVS